MRASSITATGNTPVLDARAGDGVVMVVGALLLDVLELVALVEALLAPLLVSRPAASGAT